MPYQRVRIVTPGEEAGYVVGGAIGLPIGLAIGAAYAFALASLDAARAVRSCLIPAFPSLGPPQDDHGQDEEDGDDHGGTRAHRKPPLLLPS